MRTRLLEPVIRGNAIDIPAVVEFPDQPRVDQILDSDVRRLRVLHGHEPANVA